MGKYLPRPNWEGEKKHRDKVAAKYEKVQGLEALIETCEAMEKRDVGYIRELKVKLRTAKQNLQAMTTEFDIIT